MTHAEMTPTQAKRTQRIIARKIRETLTEYATIEEIMNNKNLREIYLQKD